MSKVSVIIPCYNEGKRILPVISAIKKSKHLGEIIVVDDGSSLPTKQILKQIKNIKLITNKKNLGKTKTLKRGLLQAKFPIVAFIDADLKNFSTANFNSLVLPVINGSYDITLGSRQQEVFYGRWSGFSTAFTGERAFTRQLLQRHLHQIFNVNNYLVEATTNQVFFRHYRVKIVSFPRVGQHPKIEKNGFVLGLKKDLTMLFAYIRFLGLRQFLFQLIFVKRTSIFSS